MDAIYLVALTPTFPQTNLALSKCLNGPMPLLLTVELHNLVRSLASVPRTSS